MAKKKTKRKGSKEPQRYLSLLLVGGVAVTVLAVASLKSSSALTPEEWQQCEIYLAPSASEEIGGWGVFANRPFLEHEIVELSPLFVPSPYAHPSIKHSILDDYIYGYFRLILQEDGSPQMQELAAVVLGYGMYYNHHRDTNVAWTAFGKEPGLTQGHSSNAVGMVSRRAIRKGEELYSTYGIEDDGKDWFQQRGIDLHAPPLTTNLDEEALEARARLYCSKLTGGIGQERWKERVQAILPYETPFRPLNVQRLPPQDAPYAIVKVPFVSTGERLEIGPVLLMSRAFVQNTPLAPLCFFWEELIDFHDILGNDNLFVQFQSPSTKWKRVNHFESHERTAFLPIAGHLGMVQRVDAPQDANCRLIIHNNNDSLGLVFELVATEDLKAGQMLRLHLPALATSAQEGTALAKELFQTGQPLRPDWEDDKRGTGDEL